MFGSSGPQWSPYGPSGPPAYRPKPTKETGEPKQFRVACDLSRVLHKKP